MATWLLAAALALSPASAPDAIPVMDASPPRTEEILVIPPELSARLHSEVIAPRQSQLLRLQRLVDFMFDEDGLGMQYQYDANYTVAQAYQARRANCLSFTLMVIALAREAGLKAHAQEIEEVLTWHQEGDTVYRNNHVNAGVQVGHQHYSVDVAWDQVIAREQPEQISDDHLLALFYSNRAVALLGAGQPAAALSHITQALRLDPASPTIWSNAGVMHMRNGDNEAAERAHQQALALDRSHSSALFNLVSLYRRTGREAQALPLQRRLEAVRARDPFDQFLLALGYEKAGDYPRAATYYQRAIRLYNGEHRFYLGLARAYLHMGDARRAERALVRAQTLSQGDARVFYQAKLDRLRKIHQ